jgi:hypothetical protein
MQDASESIAIFFLQIKKTPTQGKEEGFAKKKERFFFLFKKGMWGSVNRRNQANAHTIFNISLFFLSRSDSEEATRQGRRRRGRKEAYMWFTQHFVARSRRDPWG